jgi:hypothetical protein
MRKLCDEVTASIGRGDLPAEAMADLKRVVDEARLRLWASMESAKSGDPAWTQEFWLQRAADMCLAATRQLERGELDPASPRASELRQIAERLADSLKKS